MKHLFSNCLLKYYFYFKFIENRETFSKFQEEHKTKVNKCNKHLKEHNLLIFLKNNILSLFSCFGNQFRLL